MNSNTLKKVVITTLASIVVSAGVYFFMVPYNLTIGGTAGLSIALSKFFPEISVGVFQLGINIILFILPFFCHCLNLQIVRHAFSYIFV